MMAGKWVMVAALAGAGLLAGAPARAGEISCKMTFQLSGWSVFYKTAKGSGTVTCSNGQSMHVRLRAKGGGLTFGKTRISDGIGKFTGVNSIGDVLGHYANAEAHAGAEKVGGRAGGDQGQCVARAQRQGRGLEPRRGVRRLHHRALTSPAGAAVHASAACMQ